MSDNAGRAGYLKVFGVLIGRSESEVIRSFGREVLNQVAVDGDDASIFRALGTVVQRQLREHTAPQSANEPAPKQKPHSAASSEGAQVFDAEVIDE